MTKDEIRDELRRLGADDSDGTKEDLEQRLADAQAGSDAPEELSDDQQQAAHGDAGAEGQEQALGLDVGYIGEKVDPRANEEYSLESGPDSPTPLESSLDVAELRADERRRSAQ